MIRGVPYDAEVEYLESTGTQWISVSSFVPDYYDSLHISACFDVVAWTYSGGLFGNYYAGEADNVCRVIFQSSNNNNGWATLNSRAGTASAAVGLSVGRTYNIDIDCTTSKITLNGTIYTGGNVRGVKRYGAMSIFSSRAQGATAGSPRDRASKSRCYFFKAYNGTLPICDLIPVRVGTVGYLYDRVTRRLFGNAGTGAFLYGADVATPVMGLHVFQETPFG